ncbi:grpE protein homolog, mitochondrial-like [Drosophila hydei]|uniref:GrpE protein homolog n=1 Tax=Drosophila hydei TaxID=7224 RepID=A0A6J1LUX2_DROHY|nr:grpE protein homolog, mitochondrial-like [Drosophila hydei]
MLSKRLGQLKTMAAVQNLVSRRLAVQTVPTLRRAYSTKKMQEQMQMQMQPQQQQQQEQQQQQVQLPPTPTLTPTPAPSPPQQQQPLQAQQLKQTSKQNQQQEHESSEQLEALQEQKLSKAEEPKMGPGTSEIDWLLQELASVKVEHNELLDKYKRALADGENMRRRLHKQIDDAKIFGIQGFCKDLIEVADVLGHATQAVPKEKLNANADLKSLYEGLNLTRASLQQVFKRHGLEILDPINQKFDPNLHEALYQTQDNTVDANTVVQVTKLGYKLHKRCIRPALVGVSKR